MERAIPWRTAAGACAAAEACARAQVGEAVCLESLSYHEAWELSYFGASVLHPRTTMPAMKYAIPITIRNFFNRTAPGASGFPSPSAAGAE